jgi:hypothetical protein
MKDLQTIYKHWLPHLTAIKTGTTLQHSLPKDDWQKMVKFGVVVAAESGYQLTDLGMLVLNTNEAMETLKAKNIKLSW